LDVQISDPEMEKEGSGLDEVQSLERMNQASIQMMDQVMMLLLKRSGKRISTLLPQVMSFVATLMRPMLEKLDTVHYTQTARQLQIGSEYAKRLLKTSFPPEKAINIAESLVGNYPDHDFVIDCREAKDLGLPAEQAEGEVAQILEECFPLLFLGNTMIGFADSTGG